MALTKTAQLPFPPAGIPVGASSPSPGTWLPIGYGVSINAQATNGATGPTTGVQVILEVADDVNGTNAREWWRGSQGDLTANAVNIWPISLGIGSGGDYSHYRVSFTSPTGQAVTVSARASSTTAL